MRVLHVNVHIITVPELMAKIEILGWKDNEEGYCRVIWLSDNFQTSLLVKFMECICRLRGLWSSCLWVCIHLSEPIDGRFIISWLFIAYVVWIVLVEWIYCMKMCLAVPWSFQLEVRKFQYYRVWLFLVLLGCLC